MNQDHSIYEKTINQFNVWQQEVKESLLLDNSNLMHTYQCYFSSNRCFIASLQDFSKKVAFDLEPLVMINNEDDHLPVIEHYTAFGERQDTVIHHPSYVAAGNIIYGSGLMKYLLTPGHLLETLSLFLLSSHAGEAGHNCPIACSAGVMRVLSFDKNNSLYVDYIERLTHPSFSHNITGAQFLTEIQGGSDVGANATSAYLDQHQQWRITGQKWFCSNADADLILMTARFDKNLSGSKGLGLFLVPLQLPNNQRNHYYFRRLKRKIGTRSMATAEIDFENAYGYPISNVDEGIHLVMENVLHLSRIFNAFSVLGMARRAYQIAYHYACYRSAFKHPIIQYPLIKEVLANARADNTALLAGVFHMTKLQDELDTLGIKSLNKNKLLLRTLANLNKYYTAKWSVHNIHQCLGVLAGNGTIETFSSLPRLLRDCIVCENWEGTHFTLWVQTLKDIEKFQVDELILDHLNHLLSKIKANNSDRLLFNQSMSELQDAIEEMKSAGFGMQTLKAESVLDHIICLFAAIALTLELQTMPAPSTKKSALKLFVRQRLTQDRCLNSDYMALLNDVIGVS